MCNFVFDFSFKKIDYWIRYWIIILCGLTILSCLYGQLRSWFRMGKYTRAIKIRYLLLFVIDHISILGLTQASHYRTRKTVYVFEGIGVVEYVNTVPKLIQRSIQMYLMCTLIGWVPRYYSIGAIITSWRDQTPYLNKVSYFGFNRDSIRNCATNGFCLLHLSPALTQCRLAAVRPQMS